MRLRGDTLLNHAQSAWLREDIDAAPVTEVNMPEAAPE